MSKMLEDDVATNKSIGDYGAQDILRKIQLNNDSIKAVILTHCNTGSLATAGYGTGNN